MGEEKKKKKKEREKEVVLTRKKGGWVWLCVGEVGMACFDRLVSRVAQSRVAERWKLSFVTLIFLISILSSGWIAEVVGEVDCDETRVRTVMVRAARVPVVVRFLKRVNQQRHNFLEWCPCASGAVLKLHRAMGR